jgi:radical SAM protein with 4Fe4S-binding SPASM domain
MTRPPLEAELSLIDHFVAATRGAVFVRPADRLLLIRPEKTLGVNESALAILGALYGPGRERGARALLAELAPRLGAPLERLVEDTVTLLEAVKAIMKDDFSPRPAIRQSRFRRGLLGYPILAEIALTYDCQNRCRFCYASSPHRRGEHTLMTTDEVKRVMEKILGEAHVPSLSFTGGEATLRRDLEELVGFGARLGLRMNLISNGLRAADPAYAGRLVDAGLASAQISLEAGSALLHDRLVGREGAFARTVAGIRNLRARGIHVHTNSTLCQENLDEAPALIRFVARELGHDKLSMNMLIRTGLGLAASAVSYREIGERLPGLLETARAEGVRLIWYSPIPYCIFNPVLHGLGAKACACVDGILSLDPAGNVLPCSSFERGIGSLLHDSYDRLMRSAAARYWKEKRFVPPVCRECPDVDLCAGACPLYWDAAGSFEEIPRARSDQARDRRRWERQRRRGGSFGVPAPARVDAATGDGRC